MTPGMRQSRLLDGWLWLRDAPGVQAVLAGIAAAGMFVAGVAMVFAGQDWLSGPPPTPPESVRTAELAVPEVVPQAHSGVHATKLPSLPRAVPLSLDIPGIGVHTSLMKLGLKPDGTIAVPPLGRHAPAGWYRYLSAPGEPGPAVILGHVDSAREGPAVFYRLGDLKPGDRFTVRRSDGWITTFTVRKIGVYEKTEFPSDAVYGSVPGSEVRLVTCGGPFDRSVHHYRDNIVVFANLTGAQRAS
jgi:hypothetical protein